MRCGYEDPFCAHIEFDIILASRQYPFAILLFFFPFCAVPRFARSRLEVQCYGSLRICSMHMRRQSTCLNTMQATQKEIAFPNVDPQQQTWDRNVVSLQASAVCPSVPCRGKAGHWFHDLAVR
jgi:hypothetical protein